MLTATLNHILPAIEANFAARLPGFTFKVRSRWAQENSGGNRITFVPLRDSFQEGRQQQGVRRVTRVRVAHISAYVWAVPTKADGSIYKRGEAIDPDSGRYSLGQAEAAVNALLCALEDACRSVQYDVESGDYMDQEGEGVTEYGVGYLLTFNIRIPVVYDELRTTPVPSTSLSFLQTDGSTVTPPP